MSRDSDFYPGKSDPEADRICKTAPTLGERDAKRCAEEWLAERGPSNEKVPSMTAPWLKGGHLLPTERYGSDTGPIILTPTGQLLELAQKIMAAGFEGKVIGAGYTLTVGKNPEPRREYDE